MLYICIPAFLQAWRCASTTGSLSRVKANFRIRRIVLRGFKGFALGRAATVNLWHFVLLCISPNCFMVWTEVIDG